MTAPTPLTISVITAESASRRSAIAVWNWPATIHGHSVTSSAAPAGIAEQPHETPQRNREGEKDHSRAGQIDRAAAGAMAVKHVEQKAQRREQQDQRERGKLCRHESTAAPFTSASG